MGIGHGALGIGHRVWKKSLIPSPSIKQKPNAHCPMPNAHCPMPNAPCPMPNARCPNY
ncbi:hypothetical protein [Tolypothrix sp. VBCCA 56010]|uniref:hypothetical protein n=1 Tax=Tolypothrix sp. VBCCA 56010 TaxID=3137731 RepID=UPI003D7ED856